MKRRTLLGGALALPFVTRANAAPFSRVRPGEAGWPSDMAWNELARSVGGHLLKGKSVAEVCREEAACGDLFKGLKNPYFIGDDPGLSQTTGWVDAWTSRPSAYVVAAHTSAFRGSGQTPSTAPWWWRWTPSAELLRREAGRWTSCPTSIPRSGLERSPKR